MTLIVPKFGGTSVGSANAMQQVAHIVQNLKTQFNHVVVVTSAMGKSPDPYDQIKVTDLLINSARNAAAGGDDYIKARHALALKHHNITRSIVTDPKDREQIGNEIEQLLSGFEALCGSLRVLGEITPRALDTISGLGERIAARILAGVFRSMGIASECVDATEIVVTNENFGTAMPLMPQTRAKTRARILPLLERGMVPVVTGFIGATEKGIPTTLGRGGSDYSASIVAAVLDADEVHNYTDVDGVLSTDPRITPDAHTIEVLTAQEMAELSFYGASVLHPLTIAPLIKQKIPLRVKNTFNPSHPGTLISYEREAGKQNGAVKAVTAIDNVSMITVAGSGLRGVAGIAGRTFMAVARTGTSVFMISQASAEQNICFVVPQSASGKVRDALENEFAREIERGEVDEIRNDDDSTIITAVGIGIAETPGISGKVFTQLGEHKINILAIAQGSSECGISMLVRGADSKNAVRAIHALT
jgi:aspartate kinase